MSTLQQIPLTTITGGTASLGEYDGEVVLVVNVASKCGLTPQYSGLEALYEKYRDKGFEVVGFPANNFLDQEPGSNEEIAEFCATTYSVTFPMMAKISVAGEDQHPLYKELTTAAPRAQGDPDAMRTRLDGLGLNPNKDPDILWNFEKFLIGRDGNVVARFAPAVAPDDEVLVGAIESALG